MKRIIPLLLAAAFFAGCASNYNITLNNGQVITARGKPKYDESKGTLYFKNAAGQADSIPIVAVKGYQPESWKASDDAKTIKFLQ